MLDTARNQKHIILHKRIYAAFILHFCLPPRNRNIVRGTATSYGLGGLGLESRQVKQVFFSTEVVHTGSGGHAASYSAGTKVVSWGQSGRNVKLTFTSMQFRG